MTEMSDKMHDVDSLSAEVARLRSIATDIGGIGGCAENSGLRAVAAVADALARADKSELRIKDLEREIGYLVQYGNKDCTAMAYAAMREQEKADFY